MDRALRGDATTLAVTMLRSSVRLTTVLVRPVTRYPELTTIDLMNEVTRTTPFLRAMVCAGLPLIIIVPRRANTVRHERLMNVLSTRNGYVEYANLHVKEGSTRVNVNVRIVA